MFTFSVIHFLAALIVLAESLNKMERCNLHHIHLLPLRGQAAMVLKCLAWLIFAFASGGFFAGLFIADTAPLTWRESALMVGFAILIVRTRVKEG